MNKNEYYIDIVNNHPEEIYKIRDRRKNGALYFVIDLPGEEWRKIEEYPLYMVSNYGRVKSIRYERFIHQLGTTNLFQERIIAQHPDKKRYLRVSLYRDCKKHTERVQRLVAKAFLQNPDNLPEVNHKSEDKKDNRVINLMWSSAKDNSNWGTRNDRISARIKGVKRSEEEKERLSVMQGKPVECEGVRYNSITRCAKKYGVTPGSLSYWLYNTPPEWAERGLKFVEKEAMQ